MERYLLKISAYQRMLGEDGQLTAKGFAHGRNARCGKICLIS